MSSHSLRYYGIRFWDWYAAGKCGRVELPIVSNNRREDEALARFHVRRELGVQRLPKRTIVIPAEPAKGRPLPGELEDDESLIDILE